MTNKLNLPNINLTLCKIIRSIFSNCVSIAISAILPHMADDRADNQAEVKYNFNYRIYAVLLNLKTHFHNFTQITIVCHNVC